VYDYYRNDYEARERTRQRQQDAEAERMMSQTRARRQQRRRTRAPLAALDLLNAARRQARANA
jgi:hypothetical protein